MARWRSETEFGGGELAQGRKSRPLFQPQGPTLFSKKKHPKKDGVAVFDFSFDRKWF